MAEKRDYYEVLGIGRDATEKQISEAYRKMALEYHPDRNPGDEEAVARFKEAAEAFEVLSHGEKRARYDRYGHAGLEGAGAAPHFRDIGDIFDAFGDIFGGGLFGDLFGARGRGRRVHKGADVRCQVSLTLEEAYSGVQKTVFFERLELCSACDGSGAKPGTKPESCRYCGGQGTVVQQTGIFAVQGTCPSCHGTGTTIRHPCPVCGGKRLEQRPSSREVTIPAGIDDQTRLRLQGQGHASPDGGPPGDCYVFIAVERHSFFEREGQHLICQVPLSYAQAALGTTIEVPTFAGQRELEIPAGTQTGTVFKLRGMGMPDPRHHGRGDLLVQVHIEVAPKLSREHEEILRKLAEIEHADVSPRRKSFFETVKHFLVPDNDTEATEN